MLLIYETTNKAGIVRKKVRLKPTHSDQRGQALADTLKTSSSSP